MLAPSDDPERIWPLRPSRRRLWRDRAFRAAVCAAGIVGAGYVAFKALRGF